VTNDGDSSQAEMRLRATTWAVFGVALLLVLGLFTLRCEPGPGAARAYASRALPAEPEPTLLPPPEMDDEYFPCNDCHEGEEANLRPRELEDEHDDLALAHGDLWCLSCHDADDRDLLHRADRAPVSFEESWQLCTQCHGEKLADWRAGVHGKRTGHWWGSKEYRNCVACHDPHSPRFAPLEPKPPPIRPSEIRWRGRLTPEEVSRE
jgi:hypothetical protein